MGSFYKTRDRLLNNIFKTKYGETFKVLEYNGYNDVLIEYQDGTKVKTSSIHVVNNNPPNPNRKVIFGVGYHGVGDIPISNGGVKTDAYVKWHGMLYRVYSGNVLTDRKASACYNGTSVCENWYNFQNFARWFYNEKDKYSTDETLCLDKDLFGNGEKKYSEQTCCLLPYKLNIAIQLATKIHFDVDRNKWCISCGNSKRRPARKRFSSEEEAWEEYFRMKDALVKDTASAYIDKIPSNVYATLVNFNTKERYENFKK